MGVQRMNQYMTSLFFCSSLISDLGYFPDFSLFSDPNKTSKSSLGSGDPREKKATKQEFPMPPTQLWITNIHAPVLFKAPHLLRNTALDFLVIINSCLYAILLFPLNLEKSPVPCQHPILPPRQDTGYLQEGISACHEYLWCL